MIPRLLFARRLFVLALTVPLSAEAWPELSPLGRATMLERGAPATSAELRPSSQPCLQDGVIGALRRPVNLRDRRSVRYLGAVDTLENRHAASASHIASGGGAAHREGSSTMSCG
jgi:hypothetical protein